MNCTDFLRPSESSFKIASSSNGLKISQRVNLWVRIAYCFWDLSSSHQNVLFQKTFKHAHLDVIDKCEVHFHNKNCQIS